MSEITRHHRHLPAVGAAAAPRQRPIHRRLLLPLSLAAIAGLLLGLALCGIAHGQTVITPPALIYQSLQKATTIVLANDPRWGTPFRDTSIQAAINFVNTNAGGVIWFPNGSYIKAGATWATINMKDHVHLRGPCLERGEWSGQTGKCAVLLNNDTVDTMTFVTVGGLLGNSSSVQGLVFESSSLLGNHVTVPTGANNFRFANNSFSKKASCFKLTGGVYTLELIDNFCYLQGSHAIWFAATATLGAGPNVLLERNYVSNATGDGIRFDGTTTSLNPQLINNVVAAAGASTATAINFVTGPRAGYLRGNDIETYNLVAGQTGLILSGDGTLVSGGTISGVGIGVSLVSASGVTMSGVRCGSVTGNAIQIDVGSSGNYMGVNNNCTPTADSSTSTYWATLASGVNNLQISRLGVLHIPAGPGLDFNNNTTLTDGLVGRGAGSGWSLYTATAENIRFNNDKSLQLITVPVAPASGAIALVPTLTQKIGSGGGGYSTASASYVDVDATNLAYTVTIPVGMKLLVIATADVQDSTLTAAMGLAIFDTQPAAVIAETVFEAQVAANREQVVLNAIVTGDGNAHTIKLQFKTSAGTMTISNQSASLTPFMTFLFSASN